MTKNKHKVFLGGTCNNTTWRDELIPMLDIDYFNPVVTDWTPECQAEEERQKDELCDIHLYVITPSMTGVFSIAELIESTHTDGKIVVVYIMKHEIIHTGIRSITEGTKINSFPEFQVKSLNAVSKLAQKNGAIKCYSLEHVAETLNNIDNIINHE